MYPLLRHFAWHQVHDRHMPSSGNWKKQRIPPIETHPELVHIVTNHSYDTKFNIIVPSPSGFCKGSFYMPIIAYPDTTREPEPRG
jgi:hypothetical protein